MKKSIVLAAIVVATGIILCPAASAQAKKQQNVNVINDDESMISTNEEDTKYEIRLKGKTIVELKVNGQLIRKEDYPNYETKIQKILTRVEKDRRLAEEDRKRAEQELRIAETVRERAHEELLIAEKQRKQSEKDRERTMTQMEKVNAGLEVSTDELTNSEEDRKRIRQESKLISVRTKEAELARQEAGRARANAELARRQSEEDRRLLNELFDSLIDAEIVNERGEVKSFELDETNLFVNGIKQSKTLHAEMLKKAINKGHKSIRYKNDNNETRFSVD
ncbi:MAG: hypothetical protein EOO02_02595 [Chitinophagaceae bacterium]|nr:MAG: hypothetical protein EOO02_02595 [Chitinophagaceae bacterium]